MTVRPIIHIKKNIENVRIISHGVLDEQFKKFELSNILPTLTYYVHIEKDQSATRSVCDPISSSNTK